MTTDPLETILASDREPLPLATIVLRRHAVAMAADAARLLAQDEPIRYGDVEVDSPERNVADELLATVSRMANTLAATVDRTDAALVVSALGSIYLAAGAELETAREADAAQVARRLASDL